MNKRAIIFDLDNTIYPVSSIADQVFSGLFELIRRDPHQVNELEDIKHAIMRRPFQLVAKEYRFSGELTARAIAHLNELTYTGRIEPFEDYQFARELPVDKFLVTTGFLKLQQSKVAGMKITGDFKEIFIVDPSTSERTKKDVFAGIIKKYGYDRSEVLVVGDDLHSEIKAAGELAIDAVLYNKLNLPVDGNSVPQIKSFEELSAYI